MRISSILPIGMALLAPASSPLCAGATAQEIVAEARAERPNLVSSFPDAFAPITDDPALPRVLLIGDSISIGYTPAERELLRGMANVHRIPDNGGPTTRGLAMVDEWLGSGRWEVIHFNFGLHDIARVNHGQPRSSIADYEKNMRAIIARLRRTGARLIFATTTPVPPVDVRPVRHNDDVVAYNRVAIRIATEAGVVIDDLHAKVIPSLAQIQQPANVHFTTEGYRLLARLVAASIRGTLEQKAPKSTTR